VADFVQQTA